MLLLNNQNKLSQAIEITKREILSPEDKELIRGEIAKHGSKWHEPYFIFGEEFVQILYDKGFVDGDFYGKTIKSAWILIIEKAVQTDDDMP